MTRFQLAWNDNRTGRARIEDDDSARPLVWVRITRSDGHDVLHVNVYGDGVTPGERRWLVRRPSVLDALMFAAAERNWLRALRGPGEPPADELGETWTHHSVVGVS
ncbi:hypothetical protein [Frigoribacterium sp. PhB24]|uniref:hypothetical protein n=1 Tax=Frigoribacterium sp. PhB24 TaxID=2485204 RepID=UPI000F460896|nr:hypothetical protein [Frigoribacterium sp. PhB24]ROS47935.1 hypothetical protein EDF50_3277 [Frigoribacterium sp. PhB24]